MSALHPLALLREAERLSVIARRHDRLGELDQARRCARLADEMKRRVN